MRRFWATSEHILNPEDSTLAFMQDVLGQVLTLFPGRFIHVGGDEALKTEWKASPRARGGSMDAEDRQGFRRLLSASRDSSAATRCSRRELQAAQAVTHLTSQRHNVIFQSCPTPNVLPSTSRSRYTRLFGSRLLRLTQVFPIL
ncbi:MAG: family 20 glycosylhydrolase [Gemmatimonadaceae bacterium]|nr:family 20 glycosylhydrolase [Gemmatimonadaceae bacterium]